MASGDQEAGASDRGQVDADVVLKQFDHWQGALMGLQRTKAELLDKLNTKGNRNEELQQKNTKLQKELAETHEMIDSVHEQLKHICTLEDEVQSLKSQINLQSQKNVELNKRMSEMQKSHEKDVMDLKEIQAKELQVAIDATKTEGQIQIDELNEILSERNFSINTLHEQLEKAESEKQAEVVRIRMDFESKIAKLQRQKSQNSAAQSSAATQEIFRKKLQFIKAESEREVSSLKQTIVELQQKVASLQREPTKLSLSMSKKRRY